MLKPLLLLTCDVQMHGSKVNLLFAVYSENTSLASIEQVGIFTEFVWWHLYYLLTNVNSNLFLVFY